MRRTILLCALAGTLLPAGGFAVPFTPDFTVVPFEFDPNGTSLVAALWRRGLGCPAQDTSPFPAFACTPGDPQDRQNEGLLLAKTGPTANPAFSGADLKGVKGAFLTELGYDLRKAQAMDFPTGSQCGVRAPRFEISMANGNKHFIVASALIGCQFPPARDESTTQFWRRPRWGGSVGGVQQPLFACNSLPDCTVQTDLSCATPPCGTDKRVQGIRIVFDVGQDSLANDAPGLEEYGLTVLDNVDVNGKLVGKGPAARPPDEDRGQGRDKDGDDFAHTSSASQPQTSSLTYSDPVAGMRLSSVGGAKSVNYSAGPLGEPCVNFTGDATVNGSAGYAFTFAACDLSAVGSDLGTFSITVNGPLGTLPYQKAAALVMGYVDIHK